MLSSLFCRRLALQADQMYALLVDLLDALQPVEGGLFLVRVLRLAHKKRLAAVRGAVVVFGSNSLILLLMPMMTVG